MSTSPIGQQFAPLLGIATLAGAVLLGFLLARATKRDERSRLRHRSSDLFRLLSGSLAGNVPGAALRRAARDAESENFWEAIEAIAATLRPRERRELARSLERSRHVLAECRSLRDDDPLRRELAARRLALIPVTRARRVLRRALVHGPEAVRLAAARALAVQRDLASLGWLLVHADTLSTRPVPALSGLLRSFGPRGRALLVTALERGIVDPRFERAALDALGLSRCRSARPGVEARLRSDALELRVAAARALGRIGMGESIPALMLALTDPAWPVRAQAAHALGRLHAAPAVEALAERVSDRSWWVRHHAAYALAVIGSEGRDALCELVVRSNDGFAREMAREALDRAVQRRSA
ncbi:MAG: HEAT repeat domain-containing protein [Candidatus Eisenbacteria bacterium]|uniref:HEAT repeat domain-containing protein n=1 Tax=Eiseniibacteriota bacterium TaxID=2212470 RepID=A0A933SBV4_UNCEI|nr:HEAT repeat domain-containing protein [Candidatus Eisenbacteria bacterium]